MRANEQCIKRVGPYRLESLIGEGGYGEVWLAVREGELAQTRLAVKLPRASRIDLAAIRREAGLWARIESHPNILPIFEATIYDDQVVVVSEYMPGGSLAQWLETRPEKAATADEAACMTSGILAGLEHLHRSGIVHRDIKPANVLLQNGVPRLADFGLSQLLQSECPATAAAGTPAFMAPEAFGGARSIQTDLWSVGIVLYQLLTGVLPFPGKTWAELFKAIATAALPTLPSRVPCAYEGLLGRFLAKEPHARFRSAAEASAALAAVVAQCAAPPSPVRLLVHHAVFVANMRPALFANLTNHSETVEREITHIWIEAAPRLFVENPQRLLPKRLKPQETWETWIELGELPHEILDERLAGLVRARLSNGQVLNGEWNHTVPEQGRIPGGPFRGDSE